MISITNIVLVLIWLFLITVLILTADDAEKQWRKNLVWVVMVLFILAMVFFGNNAVVPLIK